MTSQYSKFHTLSVEENFFAMMDVDVQMLCAAHPEQCYFGSAPSLKEMNIAFNREMTCSWIARHLQSVVATFGTKDNIPAEIIGLFSQDILSNYGWLTASEFMLFCSRVRVGRYGKLAYGQITLDDVTSKIPQFISERENEMTRYRRQREQEERDREAEMSAERIVSHSEAHRIINAAADGDVEAQHLLNDDPGNWSHRTYEIEWGDIDEEFKQNIARCFCVNKSIIPGKLTARFENAKYPKFLEGIEKGYYKVIE